MPLHQSAAERVADAGRIDDPLRRDGRHVDLAARRDDGRAVLAARDDQRLAAREDVGLARGRSSAAAARARSR